MEFLETLLEPVLIVGLALNFVALGVSRIRGVINAIAVQGVLVGICPVLVHSDIGVRGILLTLVTIGIKGFLIPWLLLRAMREVDIQHEIKPVVSFLTSILLGAVGTGLAMVFASTLEIAREHTGSLLVPAAFATIWTGFLMLTTRKKAINQVLGYLMLENGIYLFGLLLLEAMPFLVEVGVLLDVFTGVFVMGIIIHHINRELASISTENLAELKD